jgi:K(+)-stimulated pyrophosphate-energized sodium pump
MAADLFETYAVTVVATMVLAALTIKQFAGLGENLVLYPLALGGVDHRFDCRLHVRQDN